MALQEELRSQGDFLFRRRSYLPVALVVAGIATIVVRQWMDPDASEGLMAEILEAASVPVGLAGLAIRAFTVGYTPERTSGRNTAEGQVANVLNTQGAYSLVRNPLYLGNYLAWAGVAMATGHAWFVLLFSLAFWLYYERIVFAEEAFLRARFGDAYLQWAARTPAFLPSSFALERPTTPFSWRKVARNEKNGLLALMLLLMIFGMTADLAAGEFSLREECASISAAAASCALYVAVKGLNRWTGLLQEAGR